MRKTTIRQALTEAGTDVVGVRDIRIHKGKRPNGGAVKLVDATLVDSDGWTYRVTNVATQLLRGTEGAQARLVTLLDTARQAKVDAPDPIRDIAANTQTGPRCGALTQTGDECSRPSADGSACWQHGGDAARKGLVAAADATPVATHKPTQPTAPEPKASGTVDWEAVATAAASAAARAAVEACIAAATA